MPTVWQLSLLPASWRGVPFGVRATGWHTGRRTVTHQYAFRDQPYTEDLGREARALSFSGFVVGDNAGFLAADLLVACERKGAGELVHPIYGASQQQLLGVETEERWDNGRVIEFRFRFIEPGAVQFPTTASDTQGETKFQTEDARETVKADYSNWQKDVDESRIPT